MCIDPVAIAVVQHSEAAPAIAFSCVAVGVINMGCIGRATTGEAANHQVRAISHFHAGAVPRPCEWKEFGMAVDDRQRSQAG